MDWLEILLLALVLLCGIAACLNKNLFASVIIFMAYSVIMSVIWALLKAPDLSITEAAVGAGVSGILLLVTLKKLKDFRDRSAETDPAEAASSDEETGGEA